MAWSETFLATFKDNDVRLVAYVPDNVLTPLIKGVTADNYFMSVCATREDEAIGMVAGAWMGGMKGVVMMQTSGFALDRQCARLADRALRRFRPIMVISERGTLGEFNVGQHWWRAPCGRCSMRSASRITRSTDESHHAASSSTARSSRRSRRRRRWRSSCRRC